MSRGPIVTKELFDYVKNLMDEVPKKKKETLEEYATRLNEKYNKMKPLSSDTYSRIKKYETHEAYRVAISKKHPDKASDGQDLANNKDDKTGILDEIDKAIEALINIKRLFFASQGGSAANAASNDEYVDQLFKVFGKPNVEVIN